jgi:hypothetical protein
MYTKRQIHCSMQHKANCSAGCYLPYTLVGSCTCQVACRIVIKGSVELPVCGNASSSCQMTCLSETTGSS